MDPKLRARSVARHLDTFAEHKVGAFTLHDLRRTVRTGLAKLLRAIRSDRCLLGGDDPSWVASGLRGHGYIPMVPKLLAGVAVGAENGNASQASRPAPARPTVAVSTWPPAIGDPNTGVPAGT